MKDNRGNQLSFKPLSDVAEIVYGTRVVKKHDQGTKYPVYGGGGATFSVDQTNRTDCTIVARFGMSEECVRLVKGDFFLNDSGLTVESRDTTRLSQRFLDVQLLGRQPEIYALGRGTAQKNLDVSAFKTLPIAIPPLDEQHRIVAILDKAFEGLERARAHTEANLQNARELFDEAEAKVFSDFSARSKKATLGQLAAFRNGLNYSRTSKGAEVKVVGVGDFKDNFEVPTEALSSTKIDGQLGEDDRLIAGDILAVRSNGNRKLIGRTMLMPKIDEPISFSGFSIRIRLMSREALPEYVCSYLRTKTAREQLTAGGGGANISNLNQRLLSSLPIFLPDINDQREALDRLKLLRSNTSVLRGKYIKKLKNFDDLRQSLLQKAFAGELN